MAAKMTQALSSGNFGRFSIASGPSALGSNFNPEATPLINVHDKFLSGGQTNPPGVEFLPTLERDNIDKMLF
jgi:hypothetical protein